MKLNSRLLMNFWLSLGIIEKPLIQALKGSSQTLLRRIKNNEN